MDDVQHDIKAIIEDDYFLAQNFVIVLKYAKEIDHRQQDRNKANADQCRLPQPNFNVGFQDLVTTHVLSKAGKNVMAKFVPKRL